MRFTFSRATTLLVLLAAAPAPAQLAWTPVRNVPVARGMVDGGVIDDVFYVVGGGNFILLSWNTLQAYHPDTDTWESPRPPGMANTRTLPAAAVATQDVGPATISRLFVFGGTYVDGAFDSYLVADVEVYDPGSRTWSVFGQPMPNPVAGAAAATVDNKIHVVGGQDDLWSAVYDAHQVFDPMFGAWTADDPLPVAVTRPGIAVHGRKIYVFGGFDWINNDGGNPTGVIQIYDPDAVAGARWTLSSAVLPTALGGVEAADYQGRIYVAGGWDGNDYATLSSEVLVYDPTTDTIAPDSALDCAVPGRSDFVFAPASDGATLRLIAAAGMILSGNESNCTEATVVPAGPDTTPPDFSGAKSASETTSCPDAPRVTLDWGAAIEVQSLPVSYNIYRSTTDPAFIPGPANRIAQGLTALTYDDVSLACGETAHYVIRAEDSAVPPNEDTNLDRLSATLACPAPVPPAPLYDELRVSKDRLDPARHPILDWSRWSPAPEVTHAHVYRSETLVPYPWTRITEAPTPAFTDTTDTGLANPVLFYQVRPAIGCVDTESTD
jgi:N-acetylneuraminic acid mutarotase